MNERTVTPTVPDLAEIRRHLAGRTPLLSAPGENARSAVALILREGERGPEILFIIRARNDADPWSGNIGFPGGRVMAGETERAAAERETLEEVGLDLSAAERLGQLDNVAGATQPVIVSCFPYFPPAVPPLVCNREVASTFWFPCTELLTPVRHREAEVLFDGRRYLRPTLDLLGPGQPLLWGLTYRLVSQFLSLIGHPLPAEG